MPNLYNRPAGNTISFESLDKTLVQREAATKEAELKKQLGFIRKNLHGLKDEAAQFRSFMSERGEKIQEPNKFLNYCAEALKDPNVDIKALNEEIEGRLKAQKELHEEAKKSKNPGFFAQIGNDILDKMRGLDWKNIEQYMPLALRVVKVILVDILWEGAKYLMDTIEKSNTISPKQLQDLGAKANELDAKRPLPSDPSPVSPAVPKR